MDDVHAGRKWRDNVQRGSEGAVAICGSDSEIRLGPTGGRARDVPVVSYVWCRNNGNRFIRWRINTVAAGAKSEMVFKRTTEVEVTHETRIDR